MKIFIGLSEIAGNYNALKKGFDELGVESCFFELWECKFIYNKDVVYRNFLHKFATIIGRKRRYTSKRNLIPKLFWVFVDQVSRIIVFIWSLFKFDVYILSFGSSFFYYLDLPILKMLNKKIIYQFHGSDIRPPYLDGAVIKSDTDVDICYKKTIKQKSKIKKIEKYADVIINPITSCHFNEKLVVDTLILGKPCIVKKIDFTRKDKLSKCVKILHAPSDMQAKGTKFIRTIILNLKNKGYDINYTELSNVSNKVVLKEIEQCDFVIDQVYSDIFMPSFSKEAGLFGKPSLVGGYFQSCYDSKVFDERIPPIVTCSPEDLESACEKLITDVDYRLRMGRDIYKFLIEKWNCSEVARRYLDLIEGKIPDDFYFNPKQLSYLYGVGMSKLKVKKLIEKMVFKYGSESLCLRDKPNLESLFISKFIEENI